LVQEIVDRYRANFEAAGCVVSVVCCDQVVSRWDRFRLEQVVANLLMNALK
jgi:signal transduction histidine kinase